MRQVPRSRADGDCHLEDGWRQCNGQVSSTAGETGGFHETLCFLEKVVLGSEWEGDVWCHTCVFGAGQKWHRVQICSTALWGKRGGDLTCKHCSHDYEVACLLQHCRQRPWKGLAAESFVSGLLHKWLSQAKVRNLQLHLCLHVG